MSKIMIYGKKNIPFQKTPVILIKKNKSIIGGTGDTHTWTGGSLFPINALQAPFYGVFINGVFAPYIDVSQLVFSPSVDSTVDLCKIECEVKPYIPRITDGWYNWNEEMQGKQKEVTWIAGENGCRILHPLGFGYEPEDYPGFDTIPAGTDLSMYELPLIVPTYDFYIARRRYAEGQPGVISKPLYDMSSVYNELTEGKVKYSFEATRNIAAAGGGGFLGEFGNENEDWYINTSETWQTSMGPDIYRSFGHENFGTQNKFIVQGTIVKDPQTQTSWSGKQTVVGMYCNGLTEDCQPGKILPGFLYNHETYFTRPGFGDCKDYWYVPVWILKSLEVKKGPITG